MKRDCEECVACCVYWRIREIDKPPMAHCPKLNVLQPPKDTVFLTGESEKGNCNIYKERPKSCREYTCAWLDGYGDDSDRPDKTLLLFDNKNGINNAYQARPLSPGHEITQDGKDVIDRMSISTGKPIIVLNFYERQIVRIVGGSIMES